MSKAARTGTLLIALPFAALAAVAGCGSKPAAVHDAGTDAARDTAATDAAHDSAPADAAPDMTAPDATLDMTAAETATDTAPAETGADTKASCAASGASCKESGCCQLASDMCLAQGDDRLCLHAVPPPTTGPACNGPAASNLPGVSLTFPDARCSFTGAELAAGIQIQYQVVVAHDLTPVYPEPTDDGHCGQPGPSGLIVGYELGGSGQSYCVCDTGLCDTQTVSTLPKAGSYAAQIAWDGRNWHGPSDTSSPKGAPFPPGTYTLTLRAVGKWDAGGNALPGAYAVTATRYITVTP